MGSFLFRHKQRDLSELIAEAGAVTDDASPAMNEIVHRFDRKAQSIARSLTNDVDLREDLANAARQAVVTAVRGHSGQDGFASYARHYMDGAAKRELGRWIRPATLMHTTSTVSIDVDLEMMENTETALATEDTIEVTPWGGGAVADAVTALLLRRQKLLAQRYVDDLELRDIGDIWGTTESAISQRLATCHRALEALLAA